MKDIKTNIPLPEVVWFQEGPGVRNTQYTISGVKLLNVANLVDGKIDLSTSDRYISEEEAYGRYKHFMADEGDLIIASSGIKVEYIDKKIGFIHKEHLPLCMNTSTIRFKVIDDKELNIKFFMYFLKSNEFKHQLFRHITGCAQLNFGPSHLKKMIISYPPLPEQSRIVEELDLLSNIIEKKRQQLSELDNLAQSIFYDMFGDPVTNEKGWEVKKLGEVYAINPSKKITLIGIEGDDMVSFLPMEDLPIKACYVTPKQNRTCNEVMSSYTCFANNDVLLAKVTPCFENGKVGIASNLINGVGFGSSEFIVIRPKELAVKEYVYHLVQTDNFVEKACKQFTGTSGLRRVPKQFVEQLKIGIPPLSLQQLFAQKIEAIEQQKALIKQSIAETEELFNSRMDYYFS